VSGFSQKRIAMLGWGLVTCLALLVWRLSVIQIAEHERLAAANARQVSVSVSLEEVPRGNILDRNGVPLTGFERADRIVVIPQLLEDRAKVAEELAAVLDVPRGEVETALESACCLPYNLDVRQKKLIQASRRPGVYVAEVVLRYGENQRASHLIGYVGPIASTEELNSLRQYGKPYRLGDLVGKSGLEKYYEPDLKGLYPVKTARCYVDACGKPLPGLGYVEGKERDTGRRDLILTIDREFQQAVEDVLDRHMVSGAVVVMDVQTGDVLAMASRPVFDPRRPGEALKETEAFVNHALALYQPGSVFKTVVAAAALERGIVRPDSEFICAGRGEQLIACWKDEGHGRLTFADAFANSCNPTFAKVALKLGADGIIEYARRLGLGEQRLLGFPYPPDPRQDLDMIAEPYNLVNAAVGQGPVLVTPLQVASMVAAIANDGVYRVPRLVREVRQGGTVLRIVTADQGKRAVSPGTAATLRELMTLVTTAGNGRGGYLAGPGSAGKTGTAQVGDGTRTSGWFAGYFPLDRPRFAIVVLAENAESGGKTAAPLFREIARAIIEQGGLP